MKLVYLHQYFNFPDEKGSTRSYDLATSLAEKGWKVIVLSATSNEKYRNKNSTWNVIERDGLRVYFIYLPYGNHLSFYKRCFIFLKFLWYSTFKLLKLEQNIVFATSTPLTVGIPAIVNKRINGTPFIFEVRDVWPEAVIAIGAIRNRWVQKLLYKLEEIIYNSATYIVPLSTDMQKSIITRYPQLSQKCRTVIENIAELKRFKNSNVETTDLSKFVHFNPRFSVLYAGTFGRVNGVDYVVNLAEKTYLLDPLLVYILMGDGAEKTRVEEYALKKGVLNKNLFILDSVSKQELPTWYNSINMGSSFVIDVKELWANSANKFFDTLAASRPILINHEGWQAERIREANIGYVLPSSLTDSAVEKFVEYTQNIELHKLQSLNAFHEAKQRYSLDVAVKKIEVLLNNSSNV